MSSTTPSSPPPFGCGQVRDRLEAYLDRELDTGEHAAVETHLAAGGGCRRCRQELERARRLRDALRALPLEVCPPELVTRAFELARREESAELGPVGARPDRPRLAANDDRPGPWSAWQLAGAAAAAALLVIGLLALDRLLPAAPGPLVGDDAALAEAGSPGGDRLPAADDPAALDDAELARATAEARLALAYVASVGRRSAILLRDEVVGDHVIAPSARALQRAMDPLLADDEPAPPRPGTGEPR